MQALGAIFEMVFAFPIVVLGFASAWVRDMFMRGWTTYEKHHRERFPE